MRFRNFSGQVFRRNVPTCRQVYGGRIREKKSCHPRRSTVSCEETTRGPTDGRTFVRTEDRQTVQRRCDRPQSTKVVIESSSSTRTEVRSILLELKERASPPSRKPSFSAGHRGVAPVAWLPAGSITRLLAAQLACLGVGKIIIVRRISVGAVSGGNGGDDDVRNAGVPVWPECDVLLRSQARLAVVFAAGG